MPPHDLIALGRSLPLWSVVPFAGLLLSIALFPLFAPALWARHYAKVCLAFSVPVAGFFLLRAPRELLHAVLEYASFLLLLASLFTISGGILLRGTLRGSPAVNCAILAVGAVLSNVFGTTGASMLLIRPLLRANAHRRRVAHVVVFFIFVVANIGGSLTPIGDPPLFLGYLRGVPFFWTVRAMGVLWVVACALVIGVFFLVDRRALALEMMAGTGDGPVPSGAPDMAAAGRPRVPLSIEGNVNLPLLMVVIGIMVYLAFRFEWKFSVAAIVANLHDVILVVGVFSIFGWEFSLPVLAAVLAVLGYSVNESVIIFDRVREHFKKMRRAPVVEVIDSAITATISRTIITHGCTLAMSLSMLFFGGPALHYFALALTIGILFGIYSSVFVAAAIAMYLGIKREDLVKPVKREDEQQLMP